MWRNDVRVRVRSRGWQTLARGPATTAARDGGINEKKFEHQYNNLESMNRDKLTNVNPKVSPGQRAQNK